VRRAALFAVAVVAACGRSGGSLNDGMFDIHVTRTSKTDDDGRVEHSLIVAFDLVINKSLAEWESIDLRAACQVGPHRFVERSPVIFGDRPGPGEKPFVVGERNHRNERPFLLRGLPDKPTLCELALFRHDYRGSSTDVELQRVCATDEVRPGACAPNPAHPPASGPPLTTDELTVSIRPRNEMFREALLLHYVVTAHADMKPGAAVHLMVTCAGLTDDIYHTELAQLRAGESFAGDQLKFQGNIPPRNVPCTITYALAGSVSEPGAPFATFCYVNGATTRGACPP
jgi:hypothetical protein